MKVILNGNEFDIYELDDINSVLDRIASKLNTIPKYLYFDKELELKEGFKTNVIDILEVIKTYKDVNFMKLNKEVKEKLPLLRTKEDILYVWLCYSKSIKDIMKDKTTRSLILYSIDEEINNLYDIKPKLNIEKYINEECGESGIKKRLEDDIKNLQLKVKKINDVMYKYNSIKKGINYSIFILEKLEINYTLDLKYVSLIEIFNSIKLSKSIPCASFNNYFKISKEYNPFPKWNETLNDYIILRVNEKINPRIIKVENYSVSYIYIEDNLPVVKMIINLSNQNISNNEYVNQVFKCIDNPKILNIKENLLKGVYTIQKQSFDKYVFSDMVLNNPIFSKILNINEKDVASKTKSELYIYLNHPIHGIITANLIEYISEDVESEPFIKVHIIRARNMEGVLAFQETLSKLFVIYNNEYDDIIKEYRKYIPSFGKKDIILKEEKKKILRLGDVNPEILDIPKEDKLKIVYTRMCDNIPRVVSEEEAIELNKNNILTMKYPKDDLNFKQNYYVCDEHGEYKYPGLTKNKFPSKDKVIGLPCCYKEDHSKKNSIYKRYYETEDVKDVKKIISQKMIISNKFVGVTSTGILPKNILTFFETIDPINEYRRTGMTKSENSFIECVLEAMNIGIFQNITTDTKDRQEFVKNERLNRLSKLSLTGICRQEIYTKSVEEIHEYVKGNEYFDPKIFIRLLEEAYKCNIFIFDRENVENGEMTLPNFSKNYLKYENNNPYIFIYINPGNVADVAEYPQCELIIRFSEGKSKYSFEYDEIVSIQIKKMYDNLSLSYIFNKNVNNIKFGIKNYYNSQENFINQLIDVNGKTRILYIKFKGSKIVSLITDPIPPLPIPEVNKKESFTILNKLNISDAMIFAKEYYININKQVIKDGFVKQLVGTYGNINVSIPIEDTTNIKGLEVTNELFFIENTESVMDIYNKNKKYAKYIIEYAYWLLSNYINNKKITLPISDKDLDIFIKENIEIIPSFKYKSVNKIFSYKSGVLNNNKLVLLNKETLDRLYYVLKLGIVRNMNKIIDYHNYKTIDGYFEDINDLDTYPNQVILYGTFSVEKWINEKRIEYKLYNRVKIDNTLNEEFLNSPYFFKNNNISENDIYLAQNTNSLNNCMNIAKNWVINKYNIGNLDDNENLEFYECTLYAYESASNIKIYNIDGIQNNYDIKILGYKILINDILESRYTVLLKL